MIITVRDGNKPSYEIDLDKFGKEVVSFGRQSDNDIVLSELCASRVHGCFYKENGVTYVEDMNSTNGLRFRGNKIKRTPLKSGDAIEISKAGSGSGIIFTCISESKAYAPQPTPRPMPQSYQQPVPAYPPYQSVPPYQQPMPVYPPYQQPGMPRRQLNTKRSITVFLILNILMIIGVVLLFVGGFIITIILDVPLSLIFTIYSCVFYTELTEDVNTITQNKYGENITSYCMMVFLLSPLTAGIYAYIWHHRLYKRVGDEARSRGIQTNLGPGTYWIFYFLLGFTMICPFIALHKLFKTLNQLCNDYNRRGF